MRRCSREPKVAQSVELQQEEGQDIDSSDGISVVISFEKLFARPAKDGDGGIVFGRDDLKSFAAKTWVVQFKGPSYF
ncbi:hypothetical protein DPV78_006583 [Talaromyces pinophilus]|nr:hypothetical protein DPV78_006583 [Talaromyces pinophilus]